ncbi:hypothetical protein CDD80_102 [Ophiocordyceps camponoti-rufipedis]|uniref:Xylanolytic transcriptional activator regulatory domain-containing protein n=1 Tax=Ophiocordyceps camponoti-rufipedis TaxID=2004952 RepID=A0A2C5ZDL5_9HYPO|nr:hypothetical protein CDD80_102 [Ophiocordyceps camponoti-rufipedis]
MISRLPTPLDFSSAASLSSIRRNGRWPRFPIPTAPPRSEPQSDNKPGAASEDAVVEEAAKTSRLLVWPVARGSPGCLGPFAACLDAAADALVTSSVMACGLGATSPTETHAQTTKREYAELCSSESTSEEFLELLRTCPEADADQMLRRLGAGVSPGEILRQARDGNLLVQASLAPEARFRRLSSPYLKPFHAAQLIEEKLSDLRPSKWTLVVSDDALLRRLLSVYFLREYPYLAMFHKDYFLQDMATGRPRFCSRLLVHAVLARACQNWEGSQNQADFWNPETLYYRFLAEARRLWELAYRGSSAKLTTIQAATLIDVCYRLNGLHKPATSYLDEALDMAEQTGLFREAPSTMDADTRNARDFTAWCLYTQDVSEPADSQTMVQDAGDETAAQRASEQARLRKERREAKIRAGGSARLNKITGMGGRVVGGEAALSSSLCVLSELTPSLFFLFFLDDEQVTTTTTASTPMAVADPEEVDLSQHLVEAMSPSPRGPSSPTVLSEAQLRKRVAELDGGDGSNDDAFVKMLSQMMSGSSSSSSSSPFPGLPFPQPPSQQQEPTRQGHLLLFRLLHGMLSLGLGLYLSASLVGPALFTGSKAERERASLEALTTTTAEEQRRRRMVFLWVFATGEAVLLSSRFFWDKGRGTPPGLLWSVVGFLPEPLRGYVSVVIRYGQILMTVRADVLACVFVLGAACWCRA